MTAAYQTKKILPSRLPHAEDVKTVLLAVPSNADPFGDQGTCRLSK